MKNSKGKLIEAFIKCTSELEESKRLVAEKEKHQSNLENLIAHDNDLCDFIAEGGISMHDGSLLTLNRVTNCLEIKKYTPTYSIESELTEKQAEVIKNGK